MSAQHREALRRDLEALGMTVEAMVAGHNGGGFAVTTDDRVVDRIVVGGFDDAGSTIAVTLTTATATELRDALTEWLDR